MNLALVLSFVAMVCYAGLVWLATRRGLRMRVNQLFTLYLATMLVWQLAYILLSLSPTIQVALLAYHIVAAAASGQCIVFFFFARALLSIRESRGTSFLSVVIWLAIAVILLTDQRYFINSIYRDPTTDLLMPRFGPLLIAVAASSYAFLGLGVASLVQAYQRAQSNMERNRLRYLLFAVVISLVGTVVNFSPTLAAYPLDVFANIVSALIISYAILRYQLLDITLVVRRGLAYFALTIVIAAAYLLSILLFERLARAELRFGALLVTLLAMVAAILLQPWRDKAQAWVDRFLFREKYDSQRMLQELSRQTAAIIDLETLGSLLLHEICKTMRLERAALFLREGQSGDLTIVTQRGCEQEALALRLGHDHPIVRWLQQSERLLHSQELDMLPQFRSLWGQEKEALDRLGTDLFVPLLVKNELVGILTVGARMTGDSYSPDEESLLATLANQTAVAVENARLFAITKARIAELTALQEIGVRLVSSRSLPAVLEIVAESGARLLAADEAYIALYNPARDCFSAAQGVTAGGAGQALAWDSAPAIPLRMAARRGSPAVIEDLWLHAAVPPALARESPVRSLAAYPLRREEKVIGILAVTYHQPHSFSEEELRLLGMLTDQATLAIDNAQLFESEQARRHLADTLREVSRVTGSSLELDIVLGLVLEQLQNVVNYDGAAIMLLSEDQLEVSNARGFADKLFVGQTYELGQYALLSELVNGRKPIISSDILQDKRWGLTFEGPTIRAFIGVPLVVRDRPRGILVMGKTGPGHYSEDDLQNAVAFANQAAIAIENARLHQETISEKHKTETILRETFSGILVTDVELRIVTFNSGAEAITGYPAQEVIGKRLPQVLGSEIVSASSPLGRVIASGERVPPEERMLLTANGVRDILQGTVALRDVHDNLFGYLLSFADISRLKEVDRLKTDIVANVSHELRTPLASIKAYTELLLENVEGEDRQMRQEFLRIIDQETDRLSQLIGDLLDLSRLEAGRFEVRKVKLNLHEMLADVLAVLDVQRRNRDLNIQTDVPGDLPSLTADPEMVRLILKNLISNAIKFNRRGGQVLVALRPTPQYLLLEVSDHGIGIPAEALPHLFQKFYRVQAATETGIEGTGLGLVLTKQAVEAHGGSIKVKSKLGTGTTFTVRLPWQ